MAASTLGLVLALGGVAGLTAPPAQAAPTLGFNENASLYWGTANIDQRRIGRHAAATGARIQRIVIPWRAVQPRPGAWRWTKFDLVIDAMGRRGLRPLITIEEAPRWARGSDLFDCTGRACPPTRAHLGAWGQFAARLATRYGRAAAIEIWNGPNSKGHWHAASGPNPEVYARTFTAAARRIHAARPRMPVLIGRMAAGGTDRSGDSLRARTFLSRFYSAVDRGALRRRDGLAMSAPLDRDDLERLEGRATRHLAEVRAVRDRLDPGRSIWITEAGLTTTGADRVTPEQQRDAIETLLDSLRSDRDIAAILIHALFDHPFNPVPTEQGWGVIHGAPSFAPKPAYCRLVARAAGPLARVGCRGSGPRFRLGKLSRNERNGTAQLRVRVPGPGRIVLSRSSTVKRFARERPRAGTAALLIRPTVRTRRRMVRAGRGGGTQRVGTRIRVRYLPDHGEQKRLTRPMRLVRRR